MVKLAVLLFGATLCTIALAKPELDRNLAVIDSIHPEKFCAMQGGQCVIEADCPEPTAVKGLCPEQRSLGVECCYGVSRKETRCRGHGGGCTSKSNCGKSYIFHGSSDCPEDSVCCIFLYL